jgi:hypothetical protein
MDAMADDLSHSPVWGFIHGSTGFDLRRPVLIVGVVPADVSISKIWTPFMDLPAESRSPMVLPVFLREGRCRSSRLWRLLV